MKHALKHCFAIIVYFVLIVLVDFIMGIGIKDQWDKLIKWSRK